MKEILKKEETELSFGWRWEGIHKGGRNGFNPFDLPPPDWMEAPNNTCVQGFQTKENKEAGV